MSYTKDWRAYPPAFMALLDSAASRKVTIPCADARDAKRLEGRLHAFFGVLHRNAAKPGADPEIILKDNLCRNIKIKAVDSSLIAIPRDMEADNALILAALSSPENTTSAQEPSLPTMSAEMQNMFAKALTTNKTGL